MGKRDYPIDLEKQCQKEWEDEKVFHVDAPTPDHLAGLSPAEIKEKYPYMNGSLHLGHAFTISNIEFSAGHRDCDVRGYCSTTAFIILICQSRLAHAYSLTCVQSLIVCVAYL